MNADDWESWWTTRGEAQVTLLLWAVWNPIGTCPPDEYDHYSPRVVEPLREAHEADLPLVTQPYSDAVQLERNKLWTASVERVAHLLADWRSTEMELPGDWRADVEAAHTLLDWFEWEMNEAEPD
jgi:hypothetical protein